MHSKHEAHELRCPGIAKVSFHHHKFINVSSAGDRKTFFKNISSTKRSRDSPFERISSHHGLLLGSVPLILPVPNADALPITQKRGPGLREQSAAGGKGGRVFSREPPCQWGEHCPQHTHTHGSRRGSQPGLPLAPSLVLGQAVSEGQQERAWGTRPCPAGRQESRHSPRRSRHTEQHVHAGRGAER